MVDLGVRLQYTKYFCGKMASSDEKSLAVGHISGFQIDPKETLNKSSSAGGESFAPSVQF